MALRTKKAAIALLGGLLLSPALFAQPSLQYPASHRQARLAHFKKTGAGMLTIDDKGISFAAPSQARRWHWDYEDVQQLKLGPASLTVLTYKDDKWKFGADRGFTFDLEAGKTFDDARAFLSARLGQRFVAAVAGSPTAILWQIPVKHRAGVGGDEGVLKIGADEITYESVREGQCRTWRYEDIDNISSPGPFELTITTFERAKFSYGNRKQYNFTLKQRLPEARFNDLWLRLNESKGLQVLHAYRNDAPEPAGWPWYE